MKTVILMGAAWKFSKKSWKSFLEKWTATGEMPVIDRFATCVCVDAPNITDWSVETVSHALEDVNQQSR